MSKLDDIIEEVGDVRGDTCNNRRSESGERYNIQYVTARDQKQAKGKKKERVQVVCIRLMAGRGAPPIRSLARLSVMWETLAVKLWALWENGGISTLWHHSGGKQVQGR